MRVAVVVLGLLVQGCSGRHLVVQNADATDVDVSTPGDLGAIDEPAADALIEEPARDVAVDRPADDAAVDEPADDAPVDVLLADSAVDVQPRADVAPDNTDMSRPGDGPASEAEGGMCQPLAIPEDCRITHGTICEVGGACSPICPPDKDYVVCENSVVVQDDRCQSPLLWGWFGMTNFCCKRCN
jgi:hypothetical protein